MIRKAFPFLLVLALAIIIILVRKGGSNKTSTKGTVNRNRGFDRRTTYLEYTQHAKCRMSCRKISQEEVEEIMRDGKINYNKSTASAKPCPTYALEGITSDDQTVRIVYAQCETKTKVVTVIDLKTEWHCDCPGDDRKYKNRN